MSDPKILNPENTMMQQSEGNYQKYLALVLWKLAPDGVRITAKDMQMFTDDPQSNLLIHGHSDSIEFKMVTMDEAKRLAEYDRTMKGSA